VGDASCSSAAQDQAGWSTDELAHQPLQIGISLQADMMVMVNLAR
jgi:hypothetical protein